MSKSNRIYKNNNLLDYNCYNKNNKSFNVKNKINKIDKNEKELKYKNLNTGSNIDDNLKKKKRLLFKSNSTNNKNIIIDLNDNSLKNLFNLPLYYNNHFKTKKTKED